MVNISSSSISVIIPVYNDQLGLDKCLQALQQQTLSLNCFDVIVVDNGSDNPAQNLVAPELKVSIISCVTKGSYAARNTGVAHAEQEIIAFLDADCLPLSTWLENGLNALESRPNKTIIGGEVQLISSNEPTLVEQYQCLTGFGQQANIENKKFTATANVFMYRSDFGNIGYFDERLLSGGDREWAWRAEKKGYTIGYCGDAIVNTPPRRDFSAALKQARRVTGGRHHFKQLGLIEGPNTSQRLSPQRSSWESVIWILNQKQVSLFQRIQILGVATLLKATQFFEMIRLKFGAPAERC